jgi:hypothetical protein
MNHAYRLVWNEATQRYVPAAEGARSRKKSGGCKALKSLCTVVAIASLGITYFDSAHANPLPAQQCDRAAGDRGDRAFIDDAARRRRAALELVAARQEVGIRDVQRGGDEPPDIHLRTRREQHTVGVDQEDLSIGDEVSVDLAGIRADDAVERNRGRRRLHELHCLIGSDVELLPIEREVLALLAHCGGIPGLADTPLGYLGDPASARAEGRRYFEPRLTVDPSGEHR